ncbi:unnamed protein product [Paramecium primaurelia]|uniref:Uncharacterized protein n=1 Tax=Paramecium primaurelia TaxID=5886 RepID=A0A8S1K345_PARPR|nr:unnamed protein product [Paramecium primaurelia]
MSSSLKQSALLAAFNHKGINPLPKYEDIRIGPPIVHSKPQQIKEKSYFQQQEKKINQSQVQKQNGPQESAIVQHIRIIFMFYVQFGNKTNIQYLKSSKFIKAIADANIITQELTSKDLDILYFQTTKNTETLTLDQFKDLLVKIATKLYKFPEQSKSFVLLYKNHLSKLYEKINDQTDFGYDLKRIEVCRNQINEQFLEIISQVQGLLSKIHGYIFLDQSQKVSQIQSQYMHFLQQFEIIPLIITQTKGQMIFFDLFHRDSILNLKNDGKYLFNFSKFVESLIIISFHQIQEDNQNGLDLFFQLLERLENSQGFQYFSKQNNQTKNEQTQLVMPLSRVNSAKQSRISTVYQSQQQQQQQNSNLKQSQLLIEDYKQSQINSQIPYEKELRNIFEYYSQIGEPLNLVNLKSIKYKKLLQNCNIIGNLITQVDADMFYIQSTPKKKLDSTKSPKFKVNKLYDNDNQNGKMDFINFYNSLQLIAEKFNGNDITGLIEQYLIPLETQLRIEKQEYILQILMLILDDPRIIKLFEIMQEHFEPYYNHYTKDLMTLSGFMKFSQDFELANSIVSKGQLMHVFKAIASLNNTDTIDKHQFVEAISVIAILIYNNVNDNEQKIIYLLERITQSNGAIKVSKQLGIMRNPQNTNLIQLFRYQSHKNLINKDEINFNKIINQIQDDF